jgi:hypothetical protein
MPKRIPSESFSLAVRENPFKKLKDNAKFKEFWK